MKQKQNPGSISPLTLSLPWLFSLDSISLAAYQYPDIIASKFWSQTH